VAAREGAVNAKRAGLCQLRDLLITTPEPLRSELRPLTRARLLQRLAATRPHGQRDAELRGSLLALRSIARRVLQLTAEERELAREIEHSRANSHHNCSSSQASDHTPPHSSSSPGHTTAASPRKQPSRGSPAQHRYPPPPARRSATASTAAATENSTALAHDPRHAQALTPRHGRLHRTPTAGRQDATRSKPLPQALPRPQPLPATRTRSANRDLTDIEASLAHTSVGLAEYLRVEERRAGVPAYDDPHGDR
jgi:hypothetical protein